MNVHATLDSPTQPRFLMCPPRHFAVTYSINPWMDPRAWSARGAALFEKAQTQWAGLRRAMDEAGAALEMVEPAAGLADLVFTANAAVVCDRKAVLARFRHGERQNEEPVFAASFAALKARGVIDEVVTLPQGTTLEGAGDCLFDPVRQLYWMGSGFRSDAAAAPVIAEIMGARCVPLELADPSFYHLDTALCALPCGGVIFYPRAFTPDALAAIHREVEPAGRIALNAADAARFAANAVCVGRTVILSRAGATLRRKLEARGYTVVETPLGMFLKSGGSACCLTLRLDHRSRTIAAGAGRTGSDDVVSARIIQPA
jgi:N-dimethylarginine dimethylaminohydrolase